MLLHNSDIQQNAIVLKQIEYISNDFASKNQSKILQKHDIITVHTGDVGTSAVIDGKFIGAIGFTTITTRIKDKTIVSPYYLCHYLNSQKCKQDIVSMTISDRNNLNQSSFEKLVIPIPPLETQARIVQVLDNFDSICSDLKIGLPAEIEARQKQYEYYRDLLLSFSSDCSQTVHVERERERERERARVERSDEIRLLQFVFGFARVTLGEIATLVRGDYITKKNEQCGNIPVILGGQEPAYYINRSNHSGEMVAISRSGASAGFVSFWNQDVFITDGFGLETIINVAYTKYLYYALKTIEPKLNDLKRGAGVPHINSEMLLNLSFILPDLHRQSEIVSILDRFDALCNDLSSGLPAEIETRKKQYEYYRDQLLTFKKID